MSLFPEFRLPVLTGPAWALLAEGICPACKQPTEHIERIGDGRKLKIEDCEKCGMMFVTGEEEMPV